MWLVLRGPKVWAYSNLIPRSARNVTAYSGQVSHSAWTLIQKLKTMTGFRSVQAYRLQDTDMGNAIPLCQSVASKYSRLKFYTFVFYFLLHVSVIDIDYHQAEKYRYIRKSATDGGLYLPVQFTEFQTWAIEKTRK